MPDPLDTLKGTYSVFISEQPYGAGNQNFLYLCSDASISYSVSYNGSTTGILGQSTANAIFVDPSTGAVGNIHINGTRANPTTSANVPTGFSTNLVSNAEMYTKLKGMLTKNQMFQNAYILRIYNVDWSNSTAYNTYKDLYVHITKYDMSFDWKGTSDASVSVTCYRRNPTKGFGDA